MRLNQASDFALRILMLLSQQSEPVTVDQIANQLELAQSHVMKIVAKLVKGGYATALRGRNGGVVLGKAKTDINVGAVVRLIENDFAVVDCLKPGRSTCTFAPSCVLSGVMSDAAQAFLNVLDAHTLATIAPTAQITRPPAIQTPKA